MSNDEIKPIPSNDAETINNANKNKMVFALGPNMEESLEKAGYEGSNSGSLMFTLAQSSGSAHKAPALAFTENPAPTDNYLGLYKSKRKLIPDDVLKQIRITDNLVASILRVRGSMMSLYGHLKKDRFDIGVEVAIKPDFFKILTPEQYEKVTSRMKRFEQLLLNCGHTEGLEHQDRITLAEWMNIQTMNGLTFGRFATEVIYDREGEMDIEGNYPFFRFRPIDVGTIVRAVRKGETIGNNLRLTAVRALESLTGEKTNIDLNKLREDKFAWLQTIDGTPRNAFTHNEMLVFNLYPSSDIEHNGYPVSPMDTVINGITTHISIDVYRMLYFRNGRASKGMLVVTSDDVDQSTLDNMKLQFQASINGVSNSFRTPIFGVGKEDSVQWLPLNGEGAQDADFAFMVDAVARDILSAFGMSPDELPGHGHLSKGTNSQTLSESNNEFKMTAARDASLRPLILKFQTFFNQRLFPIMDPLLSKVCEIRLSGIDAQSKEQESARLQQDSAIHMGMDDILHQVDKDPVGKSFGGEFLMNERFQLILDKYLEVGKINSQFFDNPAAAIDPLQRYKRDPFFLQNLQLLAEVNPLAIKAFFAPKPFSISLLKMNVHDMLEEEE